VTYQVMPDLSPDEYTALRQDIFERGCLVPVEYDESGNILDGHHRVRICTELGIPFERIIRAGLDEGQNRQHARALNLHRRHLNSEQKRSVIAEQLKDTPERSNNAIAKELGVSDNTVRSVRQELQSRSQIANVSQRVDSIGRLQPSSKPTTIFARDAREQERAMSLLDDVRPGAATATVQDLKRFKRESDREEKHKERQAAIADRLSEATDLAAVEGLHHCSVEALAGIVKPGSVDSIITDPPYPREFLHVYRELAEFASQALREGGSLGVMVGQSYLPELIEMLGSTGLEYQWTLAYLTPGGQAVQLWDRRVNTFWKPILWFVKGDYSGHWVGDVTRSAVNNNEKDSHEWQQSVSGMLDLVERLSAPNETVCDPFMGSGTTGVAAYRLGRKFVGCDIDLAHVETARTRIAEALNVS